jgi:hypothetical protein
MAGVFGATFIGIEHFISAELCFGLSGLTLVLWSIALKRPRWMPRYLLVLGIAGCFILLVHWIDEFRIKKEADAFQQNLQFQLSQQTHDDIQQLRSLLENNGGKNTPTPELKRFIDTKGLEQKYPLGFALFYTDGRKPPLYYDRQSGGVNFDPSKLSVTKLTSNEICFDWPDIHATHVWVRTKTGGVVHLFQIDHVGIDGELLGNSTEGAAWVIGMREVS